jgi:hypothetical protein
MRATVASIIFAADIAAVAMSTGNIEPVVAHYLTDNPHPKSLRQHASVFARWAREADRQRAVRRRCAVQARAMLIAARRAEVSRG